MVRAQIKIPAVHGLDCVQALRDRPKGNVCIAPPNSRGEHIDCENLRLPGALIDHFDMALVAVTFTKLRRLGKFQRRVVGPRYFCFPKMIVSDHVSHGKNLLDLGGETFVGSYFFEIVRSASLSRFCTSKLCDRPKSSRPSPGRLSIASRETASASLACPLRRSAAASDSRIG